MSKTPEPVAARSTPRDSVRLRVGTLAVGNKSQRDGARLASAFESELGRLLGLGELPAQGVDAERIQISRFSLRAGERPEATGRRLAQVIAGRLRF